MNVGVVFSGGKDSVAALDWALKHHEVKCLISIKTENKESYMFHFPNIELVKKQAECLNLNLIFKKSKGVKEGELKDLEKAIKIGIIKYKIKGVVSGALASNYQRERIEKICEKLKLKCFSPNWHVDGEKYLKNLVEKGYKIIITGIAAEGFDKGWLGREINNELIEEIKRLNKKYNVNIGGEGGEYESIVLDGPVFKKRIIIEKAEKIMESENCGILEIKKVRLI